jgi:hypothetical protein
VPSFSWVIICILLVLLLPVWDLVLKAPLGSISSCKVLDLLGELYPRKALMVCTSLHCTISGFPGRSQLRLEDWLPFRNMKFESYIQFRHVHCAGIWLCHDETFWCCPSASNPGYTLSNLTDAFNKVLNLSYFLFIPFMKDRSYIAHAIVIYLGKSTNGFSFFVSN